MPRPSRSSPKKEPEPSDASPEGEVQQGQAASSANETLSGMTSTELTPFEDAGKAYDSLISLSAEQREAAMVALLDRPGREASLDIGVPFRILQSAPCSCPLLFAATVQTTWLKVEQLASRDLLAHASIAVGHSQGIASAVGMPCNFRDMYRLPRVVHALFLQGIIEQQSIGLRHFGSSVSKKMISGMANLRGAPHEMLTTDRGAGSISIINAETSVVCSGRIAKRLLKRLDEDEQVKANALPIPFPAHSWELQPSLQHLREKLRTNGIICDNLRGRKPAAGTASQLKLPGSMPSSAPPAAALPVHSLSGGSRVAAASTAGGPWSSVAASQLTDAMDFPASLASAVGFLEPSEAVDCGPSGTSVTIRLAEQSKPYFNVLSAVGGAARLERQAGISTALVPASGGNDVASLSKRIQDVACKVLGVASVPEEVPLMKVGLTSQSIVYLRSRLLADIPESVGILTSKVLLDHPSISSIAGFLAERLSSEQLAIAPPDAHVLPPITHISVYVSPGQTYPLSFGQEQMLRLQSIHPQMTAYNVSSSCWIAGGLDPQRLKTCLKRIIARHEVFGTTAVVNPPSARMRALEPSVHIVRVQNEAAALGRVAEVGRTPFRLGEESSLRAEILVEPNGLIMLNLWVHHMNHDIMSQGILLRELHMLLSSPNPASVVLPELAVQYADFAYWTRQCASQGLYDLNPLLEELAPHASLALDLPTDFPRPKQWTFKGDRVTTKLPHDLDVPYEGITPFMMFLTAFFIQLSKSSGQQTVIMGVPYHGRDQAVLEPLCGYFINMVPVVNELKNPTTVESALYSVRDRWTRVAEHSSVPFLYLLDSLTQKHGFRSEPSRNPIFQAMLNYRKDAVKPLQDRRFLMQPVHQVEAHMDFDIMVDQVSSGGTLITHNYCTDLFKPRTAEVFAGQYLAVLRAITTPEWSRVNVWRLPSTVKAVRDVQEAPAMSPEKYSEKLTPIFERLGLLGAKDPIVVDRSSNGLIMVVGAG